MPTNDAGPPEEEVPAQDPIEEIAHTATDPMDDEEVAEGELLDEPADEIVLDADGDELARVTAERDEYLAHLQRTQAEFDNYRKRMLRDQTTHLERATAGLIEQLLPVLDSFELALGSAGTDVERLRKGVELVYGELLGALEKAGLERIEAHGKPFDPEEHEAVMHVEDDGGEPGVRDVVRSGYRFKGRVIRPAMVKVAT
ncbi:MAG TPA: nucleotide exchange factor GrpE [Acidimicrobiia bacterium]|jgi:molecular chaperone GrpE|nr:nucleotide exchange factor GrpE [Acidimicrobiia bacterium]